MSQQVHFLLPLSQVNCLKLKNYKSLFCNKKKKNLEFETLGFGTCNIISYIHPLNTYQCLWDCWICLDPTLVDRLANPSYNNHK